MKIKFKSALNSFVKKVDDYLNDSVNHRDVKYFSKNISPWNFEVITNDNEELLSSVSSSANVYAIFCAEKDSDNYVLKYIGKSTKKLARERLRNHLIKKHETTGAKLDKVINHVMAGGKIKIAWIGIEPESMRSCVEEELIKKHPEADWNRENKQK